jgi:hypothetical protein
MNVDDSLRLEPLTRYVQIARLDFCPFVGHSYIEPAITSSGISSNKGGLDKSR